MYTYIDFITRKLRRTHGEFEQWSEPTGPLKARYAIFKNPRGRVIVPSYCLTPETLGRLPQPPSSVAESQIGAEIKK